MLPERPWQLHHRWRDDERRREGALPGPCTDRVPAQRQVAGDLEGRLTGRLAVDDPGRNVVVDLALTPTSVSQTSTAQPAQFTLGQNYPNPFNPSTTIEFALPKASSVELKVYTTLGQEVATLVQETMSAGRHTVSFNAGRLASGLYFYRISAGDFNSVRKMMLVK